MALELSDYMFQGSMVANIGDVVDANQLLGRIGSTGPHLHYEVRRYGELINPRSFMPRG